MMLPAFHSCPLFGLRVWVRSVYQLSRWKHALGKSHKETPSQSTERRGTNLTPRSEAFKVFDHRPQLLLLIMKKSDTYRH
ncbi:hypothetical protein RRG08_055767 [Elysia crispata]|uniref:Uncharacterized protein n=1 Tax=Elysia crispata TaxID=231223 RepID=A0AAE1AAD1_9GAST|nr:hypothetical protein RRG08_055767 [Elysia crispata]